MRLELLLVFSIVMAGCAAPESTEPKEDFDLDLDATETTGVIRGVVVDTAVAPIDGATVELLGQDRTTATTADGFFGFEDLEPGTYFLTVNKAGYDGVQVSAEVVAGLDQPPITRATLTLIPGSEPYVASFSYTAHISCAFQVLNSLYGPEICDPTGDAWGENDQRPWFPVDAKLPDHFQTEADWTPNQQGGDKITLTIYACDQDGDCDGGIGSPQRICQVWGKAPHTCIADHEGGTGNADGTGGGESLDTAQFGSGTTPGFVTYVAADCADNLCVPGTALGVGIILQQDINLYTHIFYNFVPDEGWRFLTDGAPQVPQ